MRLSSVQHAPPTRYQPQCGHGADCPARWLATIRSRRRRASQLLLRLQRRLHGSLKKVAISRLQGARAKQPLSTIKVASVLHVAATAATHHLACQQQQQISLRIKREKPTRKHRRTTLTGSTRYSSSLLETTAYSARSSEPIPLWTHRTRANTQHRDYAIMTVRPQTQHLVEMTSY